jgi:hypothetical protein
MVEVLPESSSYDIPILQVERHSSLQPYTFLKPTRTTRRNRIALQSSILDPTRKTLAEREREIHSTGIL